ncbi:hypothetical protein BGZ46_004209 [Entomortierella lignicola]|nr:hypothetical protein BGZ46_004209 [Entomortierella lignicola]
MTENHPSTSPSEEIDNALPPSYNLDPGVDSLQKLPHDIPELSRQLTSSSQEGNEESDDKTSTPPVAYVAYKVASMLLPHGKKMFGDKPSANCILRTGSLKFYVHVPLLATTLIKFILSRSPTFLSIFGDMIAKEAWGPIEDEEEDRNEASDMEIDEVRPDDEVEQDDEDDMDNEEDYDGEEEGDEDMPVLDIDLADPEGSRFEELLRWIYTDNGVEWEKCFTVQNYQLILENIFFLNIGTSKVLEICSRFEKANPLLQGKAAATLEHFREQQQAQQ